MDNAGENKALKKRMLSSKLKFDVKVKYTARRMHQQNSMAEQKSIVERRKCAKEVPMVTVSGGSKDSN